MTTPTTVDAAATGAELLLHAILDSTTPTAFSASSPGATVVLLRVPPIARAARFAFDRDRSAFVTARAALRRVLGDVLQCAPDAVMLVTKSNGRPALHEVHGSSVDFNVSHSGAVAAIAWSHTGRVGVDVEVHDARRGLRELVPAVMSVAERDRLARQPDDESFSVAFYEFWTRKEAIVKGIGVGISADLTAIDVAELAADGLVVVPSAEPSQWRLVTTSVGRGVTLSVALAGCAGPIQIGPMAECA
jgi:phosphopantetheinyl transferase